MIPMLAGGEVIRASYWNTLFGDMDTKITAILGGRTFLLSGIDYGQVLGKTFRFGEGSRSEPFGEVYTHTPFLMAATDESLEVELFDEEKKIVVFKEPIPALYRDPLGIPAGAKFFNESLEAHQRAFNPHPEDPESTEELFWVMEPNFYQPERVCSYGMAELICEGEDLEIPLEWNKYQFFRIHNLGDRAIKVQFEVADGVKERVDVPAYGCECVRRVGVTTTVGYHYFPKFEDGDPTVLHMPLDRSTPAGSMGANPVISPSILYTYLRLFGADYPFSGSDIRDDRMIWQDPHEVNDIGALYRNYFATTTD